VSSKREDITTGFVNVDQMDNPQFFIEFLDGRRSIEGEREVKQLVIDLLDLKPGMRVLDVGCGTGDDAREIASMVGSSGRVVGIDPSAIMIAESKKRAADSSLPLDFLMGEVCRLDFPNGSFDRVRTDRVLMFVPEIETAIAEIARVLRPRGRVVASELDHEVRFLDSHFPDITRRVQAAFAASNPQSSLGRQLHRLFAEQGLQNVKSVPRVIKPRFQSIERVLGGFLTSAIARGQFAEAEIREWLNDLRELEAAGLFNNGAIVFTASGDRP
jgi:ubiquinone/menaquinone biosynthesis C-methylase UbiE